VNGLVSLNITGYHGNLNIQPGCVMRIGVLSKDTGEGASELIGELSQLNTWDEILTPGYIMRMSRGCHAFVGNVISWSVVQLWLHDDVTKTTPSSCTGAGTMGCIFPLSFSNLFWFISRNVFFNALSPSIAKSSKIGKLCSASYIFKIVTFKEDIHRHIS